MNLRLRALEFAPREGAEGLSSGRRAFGGGLTLVLGPNGAGKTPLLKGVVYALGLPVELPPRIREACGKVTLTLSNVDTEYRIERGIGQSRECKVSDSRGNLTTFYEDKTFSARVIEMLGLPPREFSGRAAGPVVPPYMGTLLPMFWIDQDIGWRHLYSPLSTQDFIRDQHEEMARWLLDVPPKHRAVDKGTFEKAKARLESAKEQVAIKRNTMAALRRELGILADLGAGEELRKEREALLADLGSRTSVLEALSKSHSAVDERIAEAARERDKAKYALDAGARRLADLRRLGQELTSEVTVLGMNEVAADAFRTLCGSAHCEFFRNPEESYGRRLLYLKDQLKDFEVSFVSVTEDVMLLGEGHRVAEAKVQRLVQEKQSSASKTAEGQLVPAIDAIVKRLAEVSLGAERLARLAAEQQRLEDLINRVLKAQDEVNDLRPTGGGRSDQGRLSDVRAELARSTRDWLATLQTKNIDGEVTYDEALQLYLGGERVSRDSSFSGSTRTRIILAYHAAVVETSIKLGGHHPGFLILDAPKQHELHAADLGAFVVRFQQLSRAQPVPTQLVIGATEEAFVEEGLADAVWRPDFATDDGPRFFGIPRG